MDNLELWNRYKNLFVFDRATGFGLDVSRMNFSGSFLQSMEPKMQQAYDSMASLESGAIANPDEKRMVGHYWLRDAAKAPNAEVRAAIESTLQSMKTFAAAVHSGSIKPEKAAKFQSLLLVGVGGAPPEREGDEEREAEQR